MQVPLAFYLVALIIVFEKVHGKGNDGHNSLMALLELQMDHCNIVSLCTIKSENNGSLQAPSATCCKSCSCDTVCVQMGNCCPDFGLANMTGDIVMTNISHLSMRLQFSNITYGQFLHERYKTTQRNIDCVEAKLVKTDIRFESASVLSSYWMINTCLHGFSVNQDTARKCNSDVHRMTFENEPDLFIPVSSLKTNTTYKNIYCFRCNEPGNNTDHLRPWRAIYLCASAASVLFENPYKEFQKISSTEFIHNCNVLYKPRLQTQYSVATCDPEGVKTCPMGSDKQLDEICKAYHLPVHDAYAGIMFKRYKNIACYLCNKKQTFRSKCTNTFFPSAGKFNVEMNFLYDQRNNMLRYNESELHVLNVSLIERDDRSCKTGFILSEDMVTCKRVLCPRYFYPHSGACIPAFTRTENLYFTVVMEVLRVQKLDQASLNIFHRIYSDTVTRFARALFGQFTHGLWGMADFYDCLVISFTMPSEITYVSTLTSLSSFLSKIATLKIKIQSTAVDTVTLVSKDMTPVFFGGQLYKRGKTHKPLPQIQAYRSFGKSLQELRISSSHLCYRMELGPSEIYRDIKEKVHINSTGKILYLGDVQLLSDNRVIACIDDILQNLTDMDASCMNGVSTARVKAQYLELKDAFKSAPVITSKDNQPDTGAKSVYDAIAGSAREIIITVTLFLVVVIICLAKFHKYRMERRDRTEAADE